MTSERHDLLGELFLAASELPEDHRRPFLEQRTDGDEALVREVLAMLGADDGGGAGEALDRGAAAFADDDLVDALADAVDVIGAAPDDSFADRADDHAADAVVGGYRLVRRIGEGGMGVVWEARQERPARTVALKILRSIGHTDTLRRFELEGEVLGRLQHPSIASVFEAGVDASEAGERPFLALELVDGAPLDAYAAELDLDVEAIVLLLVRVAEGVQHAHQRGVVHRDLKPGNVLVRDDGQPKILDFGVARVAGGIEDEVPTMVTRTGEIIGTLAYMAPEQIEGDPAAIDTRVDVYALGVVAYQLLARRRPIEVGGLALGDAMRRVLDEPPLPLTTAAPEVPLDLATVVHRAIEKDRDRRYPSVEAFAADLQRFLRHEPVEARPPSVAYQVSKFVKRHRGATLGALAAFAAVVTGGIVSAVLWLREQDALQEALRAGEATSLALDSANASLDVARTRMQELRETHLFFEGLVAQGMPDESGRDLRLSDALIRSASEIPSMFRGSPAQRAWLHSTSGHMFAGLGMLDEAREQVELARACVDPLPPRLDAALADVLAWVLQTEQRFREAEAELERGLALLEDADRAVAAELAAGNLHAALSGSDASALATDSRTLEHAQQEVLRTRIGLVIRRSWIACSLRDTDAARRHADVAVALLADLQDPDDERALELLHLRAEVAKAEGDLARASELLRECIDLSEAQGRGETMSTHMSRASLSGVLVGLGERAEALAVSEATWDGVRSLVGDDHMFVARLAGNIGTIARGLGDLDRALEMYEWAADVERRVLADDDPQIAQTMSLLGSLLLQLGRSDEGEQVLWDAIERFESAEARGASPSHAIGRAFTMSYLAPALRARGDVDGADELVGDALEIKLAIVRDPLHPIVEIERKELAANARARGDMALLAERELDVADHFAAVRGPHSRSVAKALNKAREALDATEAGSTRDALRERLERAEAAR
ncbi:MAG: serine/threonine-protein kinase [Planctomycetota bacterium]